MASTWNYRVIKSKDGDEDWFAVHSAYYTDGVLDGISAEPAKAGGNSIRELRNDLQRMIEALDKEIIDSKIINS